MLLIEVVLERGRNDKIPTSQIRTKRSEVRLLKFGWVYSPRSVLVEPGHLEKCTL